MADPQYTFDAKSAQRIARAVRQVERGTVATGNGPPGSDYSRGPHLALVRIVSLTTVEGLYPAAMLELGTTTSTTTTGGPTSSTTSSTTLPPTCTRYQFIGDGTQDCWLAILPSDAPPRVGDVHVAMSIGPIVAGELNVYVKSDSPCPEAQSSTTTVPPCQGLCKWSWSFALKLWNLLTSSCVNCVCLEPTFCGDTQCDTTTTYCARNAGPPQPQCPGSTPTTTTVNPFTSTTTTTTMPPSCSASCTWRLVLDTFRPLTNPCPSSCPCRPPTVVDTSDCAQYVTPCEPPPGTTVPPRFCNGSCSFYHDPDFGWIFIAGVCSSLNVPSCFCTLPSAPAVPCSIAVTSCVSNVPTDHTTTSTLPPQSCNGNCIFEGDGAGGWRLRSTNCPGFCACDILPPYNSSSTCDTYQSFCRTGTTTSTTSTTTTTTTCAVTTTTASPLCGRCELEWVTLGMGGFWATISNQCAIGCACAIPITPGDTGCSLHITTGCVSECTSTTTACPSTTTPPPAFCGVCTYEVRPGPLSMGGCETKIWVAVSSGCSCESTTCPDVTECAESVPIGTLIDRPCDGTTTTTVAPTTTSTTSTTSCAPTTSTTTTGPSCTGPDPTCGYVWAQAGFWNMFQNPCLEQPQCQCPPPPTNRGCVGQTVFLRCSPATTTSTTLPPPPFGTCSYECDAPFWILMTDSCDLGHLCSVPPGSCTTGQTATTNCA